MTFEEKVALACGDWAAVAHLGIPALVYTDGPAGVRDADGVTAFPAPIALAAAFDEDLAERYGAAVAEEARAHGRNVLLGPTVDIARSPLAGRLPEAFGEDPCLTARLAAAYVRGVQSRHVIAMVKHFVANNCEYGRLGFGGPASNSVVSERALREIYYPPFEAAAAAGARAVMGAYNRVNGVPACESPGLLRTLKEEWGWNGFVAPDFAFAVRDPLAAARAGLDVGGLDGPDGRTPEDFASGRIPAERLDDIAARIRFAVALLDGSPAEAAGSHAALARETAIAGTVLLRNDGLLPLSDARSIAVIGPAGDDATYVMTGSAGVRLSSVVTPLAGIAARARDVRFAQGSAGDVRLPLLPCAFRAEYWNGARPAGEPAVAAVEPALDVSAPPPDLGPAWSARWTGTLEPGVDGLHRFSLSFAGVAALYVDDVCVASGYREAERMVEGPEYPLQAAVELRADRPARIRVEYWTGAALRFPELGLHGPRIQLGWQPPDGRIERAARLAAECDVAVVFANQASGEGMDRCSLALPGDQDALIAAVAAANPRTAVVLNTGGPVLMPWRADVAAILQAWYPGERFGEAIAAVLFGDADPGGRAPVTFPAATPAGAGFPDVDYDEGVLVGYRRFDSDMLEPLFPFGHGLSYGEYRYGEARIERAGGAIEVALEIENVGSAAGCEVVQLYLAAPPAALAPPLQLKGFRKLRLSPGERAEVAFRLAPRDLASYDDVAGRWIVHDGRYEALVGRSSRDIRTRIGFERNE